MPAPQKKELTNKAPLESKVTIKEKANGEIKQVKVVTIDKGAEKLMEIALAIEVDRKKAKVV